MRGLDAVVFQKPVRARSYAPWLWLLAGLFALRVAAQPAALLFDSGLLPTFESWHGGVLPYPLLVLSQLVILGWLARTAWLFGADKVVPRRGVGRAAFAFGVVYFAVMFLRLVLGATVLAQVRWFASPLPAFFHLVLATYVLLYGRFHFLNSSAYGQSFRTGPSEVAADMKEEAS